jgi:single-stranded-DNA-specific exonuclease
MKVNCKLDKLDINSDTTIKEYLVACGIDDVERYLNADSCGIEDCNDYVNMKQGCDTLDIALLKNYFSSSSNIIYIVQDSDVDGLTSCAIAYLYLRHLGVPEFYIRVLFHSDKSHGLTDKIMEQIDDDCSLLWLPDAGSNDVEQCEILNNKGIKVLITDHHLISTNNTDATVINNQISPKIQNKSLSGVGVTFKFIQYCCQHDDDDFYQSLLDLVALGNIGDVMDMCSLENRCINKWGLNNITNPFLKTLCDTYIRDGKINPTSIAWNVVPKLNAIQRCDDTNAKTLIFKAMVTDKDDYSDEIKVLNKWHNHQRTTCDKIFKEIISEHIETEHNIEIVNVPQTAYTGLIANKLLSYYRKPILAVYEKGDEWFGSCRSNIDLKNILATSGYMTIAEGHDRAFGVAWKQNQTDKLLKYCDTISIKDAQVFDVCCSVLPNQIPLSLFSAVGEYNDIWATGLPKMAFDIHDIVLNAKEIQILGKSQNTLKFTYKGIEFIRFRCDKNVFNDFHIDTKDRLEIEIVGTLGMNEYKGKYTPQVMIDEYEVKGKSDIRLDEVW